MIWENSIKESIKSYKLSDVTELGIEKWKRTLKNAFIGRGNHCVTEIPNEDDDIR